MKVSFDYDETLSRRSIRRFAKSLVEAGHEVWIVTSRCSHINNKDLFRDAFYASIPTNNVHFTNAEWKADFFKDHPDFLWHLDDYDEEIVGINKETSVIAIDCGKDNWKERCLELLENSS